MQRSPKDWLVRTRSGDVLGPYTQRELMEQLEQGTFKVEDEIAPSEGQWISAQTLAYHDTDEFTRTSTKTAQPLTQSITADVSAPHDLTPTPEARVHLQPGSATGQIRIPAHLLAQHRRKSQRSIAVVGAIVASLLAVWIVLKARPPGGSMQATKGDQLLASQPEGDSPFVRQIYSLIHAGKTRAALRQLTLYHERGPAKNDVEYLIPYSALLITEGEAPGRAQKYLEQVLESDTTAFVHSRARLWLGYLALLNNRSESAEANFLEALQLTPKDPAARFNLGRTYLKEEKYSLALDYLQLAELEAPDSWLIQIYKGRAKFALNQIEDAQHAFRAAMDHSPDRWLTYIYAALFFSQTKQNSEAQKILVSMLTHDPHYELHSPPPFGYFQEKLNYTEYLSAYSHVMDTYSGEEKELGKRYIQYLLTNQDEGRRLEAFADKGGLVARVIALKVVLDRESTAADIKKAIQRLPAQLDRFGSYAYVLRGEANGRLGMFEEAQADLQRALALAPESAVAKWAYSALLQKLQRKAEAQNQIRELLQLHPNYIPAVLWIQNL